MESKSNDPTSLRPHGERTLYDNLVEIDFKKYKEQLQSEVSWRENDRNSITVFKEKCLSVVLIGMHEKAIMKPQTTNAIITVQTFDGEVKFSSAGQNVLLGNRKMLVLQPNIEYSIEAQTESFFLLSVVKLQRGTNEEQ